MIVDSQGKIIITKSKDIGVLDISNLYHGLYFLKVETKKNFLAVKRFIKQ